jgi:hypothetical protein
MTFRFTHFFLLGFFFFSLMLTAVPSPVTAASLIPCGRTGADATAAERAPCTICHIITGGQRIISWGLNIMTFAAIAIIVAMAIFYIVSAGNEGMMTTAKSGIKAALVGFAVMLGAWLIISTTLKIFSANIPGLVVTSGGFSFSCDTSSSAGPVTMTSPATPGVAAATGGAACTDPNSEKLRINGGGTVCNNSGTCPSCNTSAFDTYITSYGTAAGISSGFIRGLIARESSCVPAKEKSESNGTKSCGLMMVNTASSTYTCEQLKDPETGIKEGVRILAAAFTSARSLSAQYGARVTVEELAAAIHNAGAGQSAASVDCSPSTGWPTIPKWGCPINPGTAEFNACRIKDYACNVGACR